MRDNLQDSTLTLTKSVASCPLGIAPASKIVAGSRDRGLGATTRVGTVFSVTTNGEERVLYSFTYSNNQRYQPIARAMRLSNRCRAASNTPAGEPLRRRRGDRRLCVASRACGVHRFESLMVGEALSTPAVVGTQRRRQQRSRCGVTQVVQPSRQMPAVSAMRAPESGGCHARRETSLELVGESRRRRSPESQLPGSPYGASAAGVTSSRKSGRDRGRSHRRPTRRSLESSP